MESTAFNRDAFYHAAWITLHSITMHGLHRIKSGSIAPKCKESSAFNDAAWNPLQQKGGFGPRCVKSTAFNRDALGLSAWTPQHYIWLHGLHCIKSRCMESSAFNDATWNPLRSIRMHFTTLHVLQCIQSQCMESTAFNRDALGHSA